MNNSKGILFGAITTVLFMVTGVSGCKKDDTDTGTTKPKACFTVSSENISRIDTVTANAACSERAQRFTWSSNYPSDTTGSTAQFNASNAVGTMNITLTAINADGEESITKVVTVRELIPSDYTGGYVCNDTCDNNYVSGPFPVTINQGSTPQSLQLVGYFINPTDVTFNMSSGTFSYTGTDEYYYGNLTDASKLFVSYQILVQTGTLYCVSSCTRY